MITTVSVSFGVTAVAETVTEAVSEENSKVEGPYYPADSVGYYGEPANIIMYKSDKTTYPQQPYRAKARPVIAEGQGVNGSTAMRIGSDEFPFARFPVPFRFATDTIIPKGNAHTVRFSVKVVSGKVDKLYAGITTTNLTIAEDNWDTAYISPMYYTSEDLPIGEWKTVEYTATASTLNRIIYINLVAEESGAVILIDNIEVFDATLGNNVNLFIADNVIVDSKKTPYSGGADNVGTFDRAYYPTDNTPDAGTLYSLDHRVANNTVDNVSEVGHRIDGSANVSFTDGGNDPKLTALGEGVKGSYALELGGSNAIVNGQYTVFFYDQFKATEFTNYPYFDAETLLSGVKLRFEADIKVKSGEVSSLQMGIVKGQTVEKSLYDIDTSKLSENWTTFTWTRTLFTYSKDSEWFYFNINLATENENGAIILIDNIRIYAEGDKDKTQIFKNAGTFNLNFDVESWTPILKDEADSFYTPSFKPSDLTLRNSTTGEAKLVCMENAHSGEYALAIGYGDQKLTNCRVRYGIRELLPNRDYRISFAISVSGNSYNELRVNLNSAVGGDPLVYAYLTGSDTSGQGSLITECPRRWTEYTVDVVRETAYDDNGNEKSYFANMLERAGWNYLEFIFVDGENYGIGDSAMFIDSVSIRELNENGEEIGPNLFMDGNFEYISNTYDWENYESPFWSGSADDFTFMSGIEKELAAYSATVEDGIEEFETILNAEPYKNIDTFFIGGYKREVMLYEAQKLKAADKKVWLSLTNFIRSDRVEGVAGVVENYKELILAAASELQLICGDNFQGFYFDEPGYYLNDEDFTAITKWLRETFKKRVFAIHYKSTVDGVPYKVTATEDEEGNIVYTHTGSLLAITKESHKYVTDVGYWRYGNWSPNAEETLNNFKKHCLGEDPAISVDARKWIVPLLGRHYFYQTGVEVVDIIQAMYDGLKTVPNFGGIGFYCMGFSDYKDVYTYEPAKQDNELQKAINEGALPEGQYKIIQTTEADGVVSIEYVMLAGGGYYMLNENPNVNKAFKDSEVARTYIKNLMAEFSSYNKLYAEENMIFDDKLLAFDAGVTVSDLLASVNMTTDVTVKSGDTVLASGDTVKSGDIISVVTPMGTIDLTIVKRYDANSDGLFNAVDIVRSKRVVAQLTDPTEIGNLAVTATNNGTINITDIGNIRNELMK